MKQPSFLVFLAAWNDVQRLSTPDLHFEIAAWLEDRWREGDRELLLMAFRNSGKSTLVGLFAAWLLVCDPEIRIMVLAADHQLAQKMVRNVRRILERHPLSVGLRPARTEEWASDRFTVNRGREQRDPSMLAKGIGANVTGSRADVVICDDVEVPNTCDTAFKREELRERLDEIDFILVPGGLRLFVGTPHTYYSVYADRARPETGESAAYLAGFTRLTLPIYDETGDTRWPDRFPAERIEAIRRRSGPAKFASQMMLEPTNVVDSRLDPDRIIPYEGRLEYREGNGEPLLRLDERRLISASCFWDPSFGRPGKGDASVIAAVFTDQEGGYWLHGIEYLTHNPAIVDRIDEATQLCRQAVSFARRHFVPAVTIETNGIGRFLPGLFRRELNRAGLATAVIEHASSRGKSERILEAFDAVLAAGRLNAHRRVWDSPFIREMREWQPGGNGRDDGLDAVAGCLLSEPVRLAEPDRVRDPRARNMTAWRNALSPVRLSADFDV
ncbi:MAG: phage terminase large subunit [Rhodospirillales bacterium]|nr:phage terminase large subunit [Rhodospirillales bacterium]MBO6788885.1 phage terminase large subunit [Rhodospirillales bacterium]